MKFSYNWLKDFIKLPDIKKTADLLMGHVFEIEAIKGDILDINILANRPDCFGYLGIAKELGTILGLKVKLPKTIKLKVKAKKLKINTDKELCPRYTGVLMEGVKVCPSVKTIQDRLIACGLNPINNIVDATNYVMLETGQPLHAFDFDKIEGNVIVRKAKNKEKIISLDNKEYTLNQNILVIADEKEPIAIAGIKGGKKAEIDNNTKTILLEAANFNPIAIRKASQYLNLRTDASLRFEHGLDPNLTIKALERVVTLVSGQAKEVADVYPKPKKPVRIKLEVKKIEKLLGLKVADKKIIEILNNLDLKIISKGKEGISVEVPTIRKDLVIQEDLIEEIGRIYGVDKIPSISPLVYIKPVDKKEDLYWEDEIRDFLKELNFTEVFTYSFNSQKQKEIFKYSDHQLMELANPLSSEQQFLRASLIPNILEAIKKNLRYFDAFQIFELGKIFEPGASEKKSLIFAIVDKNKKVEVKDFRFLKGTVESFLQELGITDYQFDDKNPLIPERVIFWHPQRLASIEVEDKTIGLIGEIHPYLLRTLGIEGSVMIAEFDLGELIKTADEEQSYRPISNFPSATRDISIIVPIDTKVDSAINIIDEIGKDLISNIDLIDMYSGDEIGEDKQSLSFRIVFQAQNRTLSSKEIDDLMRKIIQELEKELDWEVRRE